MRRAWILFLVLVMAVGGCFTAFHCAVAGVAECVTVTHRTLYGDPAAAEGVTITVRNHYDQHLLWETSLSLFDGAAPETEFTFSNDYLSSSGDAVYEGIVFSSLQNVFSFFYDDELSDAAKEKYAEVIAYLAEVEASVEDGQSKTFTVDLSEYLDYYPLEGQIILPDDMTPFSEFEYWTSQSDEVAQKINDFFRIPMNAPYLVEYTIDKTTAGSSYGASLSHKYYLHASGAVSSDACYFSFNAVMDDGQVVDTSQIPGGYGIYRLPYETHTGADLDGLKMVYALDPAEAFEGLYLSDDGKRLLLHTWQGNDLMLTVIDIATMTRLQKVAVWTRSEESYYDIVCYDDFFLIEEDWENSDDLDQVTVWVQLEDGTYGQAFSVPINWSAFPEGSKLDLFYQYENAVDYADGKLVVLHNTMLDDPYLYYSRYYSKCDVYVAVYDASGMIYAGIYQWNLTTINEQDPYSQRVQPMFSHSVEVTP